jgi:hypothetical protein
MVDDVRKKRGSDHGREEQPQRTPHGETPGCGEKGAQDDVWDGRDGIAMLEAIQYAMGEEASEARKGYEAGARTSKAVFRLIPQSRARHVGDGGANRNVKNDDHSGA